MDEGFVNIIALGIPSPAGSKNAFMNRRTGRIVVVDAGGKKTKNWRVVVSHAARDAMQGREFIAPPLMLTIEFLVARPKSHYASDGSVRKSAPLIPIVRPDVTKLLRSTEDAMTGIVYRDDAEIVHQIISRGYALDEHTGARITVRHLRLKNEKGETQTWEEWSEHKTSLAKGGTRVEGNARPSVDRPH